MINPTAHLLRDDGVIPNHPTYPLLHYPSAVDLAGRDPASAFEILFNRNDWSNSWRNGVYPFPHYHAAAHEVLGVFSGSARIQLGGSSGVIAEVQPGDVVAIPAGVGHKNLGSSNRFGVVGAYPPGQNPDIQRGEPIEQNWVREAIAKVPRPKTDPVYGTNGPMLLLWK